MSNVAEALDFRTGLVGWLDTLASFFCKDIRALPDEALTKSPGGVAKAPATIAAEVVSMCDWCAGALRGDAVNASAANLGSAIREASDKTLASVVTPPWQMPAPMAVHAQVAVNHIWYHDGQLNYLQALQGDSAVHWRD